MARDLLIAAAAFALATGAAELAGADSLGIAMAFGQMAFATAVVWRMLAA